MAGKEIQQNQAEVGITRAVKWGGIIAGAIGLVEGLVGLAVAGGIVFVAAEHKLRSANKQKSA